MMEDKVCVGGQLTVRKVQSEEMAESEGGIRCRGKRQTGWSNDGEMLMYGRKQEESCSAAIFHLLLLLRIILVNW